MKEERRKEGTFFLLGEDIIARANLNGFCIHCCCRFGLSKSVQ